MFIVLFLSLITWEIFEKAIKQIFFNQNLTVPDIHVAIMAIVGIFINFAVSSYIIHIGKQINSPAIFADGQHQRTDIFSSIAILIGVVIYASYSYKSKRLEESEQLQKRSSVI